MCLTHLKDDNPAKNRRSRAVSTISRDTVQLSSSNIKKEWANTSIKHVIMNSLGRSDHKLQFRLTLDKTMKGYSCVPIKLYLKSRSYRHLCLKTLTSTLYHMPTGFAFVLCCFPIVLFCFVEEGSCYVYQSPFLGPSNSELQLLATTSEIIVFLPLGLFVFISSIPYDLTSSC